MTTPGEEVTETLNQITSHPDRPWIPAIVAAILQGGAHPSVMDMDGKP